MALALHDVPTLTVEDVADMLNASVPFVRREVARGAIASYRFGRRIRLHPDDVAAYVNASRKPVSA